MPIKKNLKDPNVMSVEKKLKIDCSVLYIYQVLNQILQNIYYNVVVPDIYIYIYNIESILKPIYGT